MRRLKFEIEIKDKSEIQRAFEYLKKLAKQDTELAKKQREKWKKMGVDIPIVEYFAYFKDGKLYFENTFPAPKGFFFRRILKKIAKLIETGLKQENIKAKVKPV